MADDDIWNLLLTNDLGRLPPNELVYRPGPSANGPTPIPFANSLGQGMGTGSQRPYNQPPAAPWAGINFDAATLSSLMDSGVGASVIADMLPQLDTGLPSRAESLAYVTTAPLPGLELPSTNVPLPPSDTSAAMLPPSALAPARPLQDPSPFTLPDLTMDQAAMMYGMSPEEVAQIHQSTLKQAAADIATDAVVGASIGTGLEAAAVPALAIHLVDAGMDIHDALNIAQQLRDAPDQAIFKRLNDSEIQSIPSTAKAWLP